jgi:formate-dependent nitrite reductase membrane component NrfD
MKPYEWMVGYTPQTEWIEHKGILIWLSLYAGILGGGCYLVSLYFNNLWGMFISWLIVLVIKGGLHMAHAERPLKLWRMFLRPQTSWISRGLILTVLFIGFGAIQLILSYWATGAAGELIFKVLAGITGFGIIIYAGFTMSYVKGIPFWNSALLPVLYIFWGVLSGLSLVMVIGLSASVIRPVIAVNMGLLITGIILIAMYLWTATYTETTAKESVTELIHGSLSLVLWIGVFLLGIIIPLIILLIDYLGDTTIASSLSPLMLACEIIGGLAFLYCILKVGVYNPLIPARA